MPVEIITKPKTEPVPVNTHRTLVPLRVVEIKNPIGRRFDKQLIEVGDIVVLIPTAFSSECFNATKGKMLGEKDIQYIYCVRAYDIQRIIITNDNEPAPVM